MAISTTVARSRHRHDRPHQIALRLRNVSALFNSMDPSPFHEKDIDENAERFIVNWAQELPQEGPITLVVHLEEMLAEEPSELITKTMHNYFAYRQKMLDREFRHLMRTGRATLLIGLSFLGACMVIVQYLLPQGDGAITGFLRESLTIAGWVAMWRPMHLYLYDWWPLRQRARLYERLAHMHVKVDRSKGHAEPTTTPVMKAG